MECPGCFRHTLSGHRSLDDMKKEVIRLKELTNCSRISIAGGEPLLYPHIVELVRFISSMRLKPIILTNGELLTVELINDLRKAGLYQFYFHVDSNQNRKAWLHKSELELNTLRQYYIDLVNAHSRIKSGFLTTVSRTSLDSINDILQWFYKNPGKVIHMAFIAFRGIPLLNEYRYLVNGKETDPAVLPNTIDQMDQIDITIKEMYAIIKQQFPRLAPSAYLKGTTSPDTYKFLIINSISSNDELYGSIGPKVVRLQQRISHLLSSSYSDTLPRTGREVFFMSFIDKEVRRALARYLRAILVKPVKLFRRMAVQGLVLQQPFEIINGKMNLCDGCINMMIFNDELINSCRLDEYRMLGGELTLMKN